MLFHQVLVFCSDCMMVLVDQNDILMEKLTAKSTKEVKEWEGERSLRSLMLPHMLFFGTYNKLDVTMETNHARQEEHSLNS